MASRQRSDLELATFLRSRRQRLKPEDVGLPSAGRRRTPGLRREEVAILAGVSTTWYTYLEQGRGREVSPSVLDSIARVLRLTEDERRYMHLLAFGHVIDPHPLGEDVPIHGLLRQIMAIVDNHAYPVYMVDHAVNLLAWNGAATEWYDSWEGLPEEDRNFVLWLLTSPRARECFVEWEPMARDIVARWRADVARRLTDRPVQERVAEFKAKSPEFCRWWDGHEVLEHRASIRTLRHPHLGVRSMRIVPMTAFYENAPVIVYHLPT